METVQSETSAPMPSAEILCLARGGRYLTFSVAGHLYGIDLLATREIIQYRNISSVPMMPKCIRGVINLRGAVVPVLDLTARFHGRLAQTGRRSCILVVESQDAEGIQEVGLLVDGVATVQEIGADEIEPPPPFGLGIRTEFVRGLGKIADRFIILIEVERVLAVELGGA